MTSGQPHLPGARYSFRSALVAGISAYEEPAADSDLGSTVLVKAAELDELDIRIGLSRAADNLEL